MASAEEEEGKRHRTDVCFKFRKGKCTLGEACKYSHAEPGGEARAGGKPPRERPEKKDGGETKNEAAEDDDDAEGKLSAVDRKRKRVVLFGYSGAAYHGLQAQTLSNPPFPTVENALHRALVQVGAISELNSEMLSKVGWARCARTDTGVSAAAQVVSAKLVVPGVEVNGEVSAEDMANLLDKLNRALPSDIRVYRLMRVNNGFDPQKTVSGRIYGYLFPEFLLGSEPDAFSRLNRALSRFVGSHHYHNFTDKLLPSDPSSIRIIRQCVATEPLELVPGHARIIRATFNGQSFLLHQIRRMIGFAIEVVRRNLDPETTVDAALDKTVLLRSPCTAPAEGLFLDASLFDAFNISASKLKSEGPQQKPIDFLNDAELCIARESFIRDTIMPAMFPSDGKGHEVFTKWLRERSQVDDFPVLNEVTGDQFEKGEVQHFLRHVAESRYKRWMADERMRRGGSDAP